MGNSNPMNTTEATAGLAALLELATPGPWAWTLHESGMWHDLLSVTGIKVADDGSACAECTPSIDVRRPNAALIARAPDLAAEVLRLSATVADLTAERARAEAMRAAAVKEVKWPLSHPEMREAIRALPTPDHAAQLAAALALPEVAALVGAADALALIYGREYDRYREWDDLDAALAALQASK